MKIQINPRQKVEIRTLAAEEFGGEHNLMSQTYIGILKAASFWAMVTNSSQVFYRKVVKKRKDSFGKILWEMGRDPNHISSSFFDRFSQFNHQAKYGAAGWKALDLFYNYNEKIKPQLDGNWEGRMTRHWVEKMENRQAVANKPLRKQFAGKGGERP